MTIDDKQQEIIEDYSYLIDWEDEMEKYEEIIQLGKQLPPFPAEKMTDDRLIEGCQARVWLDAEYIDGKMLFTADSNSTITKGIISLLIRVFNNEKPEDIINANLFFIEGIGLQGYFTMQRSNGLVSMLKKIKLLSIKALSQN